MRKKVESLKNKRIIAIIAVTLAGIMCLSGCGKKEEPSSVTEYGEVEEEKEDTKTNNKNNVETEARQSLPTYSPEDIAESPALEQSEAIKPEDYYYRKWLNDTEGETAAAQAIAEVYKSAQGFKEKAVLQRPISPEMVQRVMNIVFLDNPELYMLKNAYSYSVNDFGEVGEIYLEYEMSEEKYQNEESNAIQLRASNLKKYVNGKKDVRSVVLSFIRDEKEISFQNITMNSDGGYIRDPEQMTPSSGIFGKNSVGAAKYTAYWLKQMGIEATVVLGEPISKTLENQGIKLVDDYMPFIQDNVDDAGMHHVEMNYSHYWCWNVVKIGEEWCNIDVAYAKLMDKFQGVDERYFLFVPDQLMSQTRLFHMTEDILGMSPSCTEVSFMHGYQEGIYVLPHTESQMIVRIGQEISAIDQTNANMKMWQFENEESFNYFINNFEKQLDIYNENNKTPIGKIDLDVQRDLLVVTANNIVHNN